MNGEVYQLIQLTAMGNGYILSGAKPEDKVHPDQEHYEVIFSSTQGKWTWSAWLDHLITLGCHGLALVTSQSTGESWKSRGFVGGGQPAGIVAIGIPNEPVWMPSWQVVSKPQQATKWRITYTEHIDPAGINREYGTVPLSHYAAELRGILKRIGQLAVDIDEEFWNNDFFKPAIERLDGVVTSMPMELPEIYSDEAQKLLNAVYKAWVFGGMGSWNDSPPYSAHLHQLEKEYNDYTGDLYHTLLQCSHAVANSVLHLQQTQHLNLSKTELASLKHNLTEQSLPFTVQFEIQEWNYPAGEAGAYFLKLPRTEVRSDLEGLALLLLRLEFREQEWSWDEKEVREVGPNALRTALTYLLDNGECTSLRWKEILDKAELYTEGHLELKNEVTFRSSNVMLYNDWNLLQLFGVNDEHYYLYLWYTSA
ncbi:MAG: hypothetical protein ACQEXX_26795 [Bacillota bacterium]